MKLPVYILTSSDNNVLGLYPSLEVASIAASRHYSDCYGMYVELPFDMFTTNSWVYHDPLIVYHIEEISSLGDRF